MVDSERASVPAHHHSVVRPGLTKGQINISMGEMADRRGAPPLVRKKGDSPSMIIRAELQDRLPNRTVLVLPSRARLVDVLGGDVDLSLELGESKAAAGEAGDDICIHAKTKATKVSALRGKNRGELAGGDEGDRPRLLVTWVESGMIWAA